VLRTELPRLLDVISKSRSELVEVPETVFSLSKTEKYLPLYILSRTPASIVLDSLTLS